MSRAILKHVLKLNINMTQKIKNTYKKYTAIVGMNHNIEHHN